jgi:hypothetical protein
VRCHWDVRRQMRNLRIANVGSVEEADEVQQTEL